MNFREMSGLQVFQAMRDGKLPHPTMADTIPMRVTEASPGYVKFHARADRRHVNPLGGVHGGFAATGPRFGHRMRQSTRCWRPASGSARSTST